MLSLPLSRVEVAQQWCAPKRLGVNQLITACWGVDINDEAVADPNHIGRLTHVLCTRVMEKPALLSIECLKMVVNDVFGAAIAARRCWKGIIWSIYG